MKRTKLFGASLGMGLMIVTGLSGCGGAQKSADGAGDVAANGAGAPAPHGTPWKDKTREQRLDWMGLEVYPKLRAAFLERDAQFGEFKCQTCHGSKMEMVDFKMPNPALFSLSKTNTLETAREYDAEMTTFMAEKVVPEMAELLDMQPYDPATKQGFGCFNCHPSDAE